jgi:hypothetical protein
LTRYIDIYDLQYMRIKIIGFFLLAISLSGCFFDEPDSGKNVVLLEDILFISSNKVRVLGRVFSSESTIQDHGFEFAKDENFTNSFIRSLGGKNSPGSFLVEQDSLEQNTEYHYRAFLRSNGVTTYSHTSILSTFNSKLVGYNPAYGREGDIITIDGSNLTNSIKVFFGEQEAEIVELLSDFRIKVKVPSPAGVRLVPISVQLDEKTVVLQEFEYITGKWTLVTTIEDYRALEVIHYLKNDEFTFAMGVTVDGTYSDLEYTINLNDFTYSKKSLTESSPGLVPTSGSFFNSEGYFGSGAVAKEEESEKEFRYILNNTFYDYNDGAPLLINATPIASFGSVSFVIDGRVFYGGGQIADRRPNNRFFEYINGGWVLTTEFVGLLNYQNAHTTHNGKEIFLDLDENWWEFNPIDGRLQIVGSFERSVLPYGAMHSINNDIYLGLFRFEQLFWRMELDNVEGFNYRLVPKNNFPGNSSNINIASFVYNDKMYFLRSAITGTSANDEMFLWQFEPNEFQ